MLTLFRVSDEHGQIRDEELDAEREARRQLALAQIRQWPDPVLKMRAGEVEVFDDDLRRLTERMASLMEDANGVGLAATQVGVVRRVFVFRTRSRTSRSRRSIRESSRRARKGRPTTRAVFRSSGCSFRSSATSRSPWRPRM